MRLIAFFLAMSSAAFGQTPDWSHGACYEGGIYFPARASGQCFSVDKSRFVQTMPPENLRGITSGTGIITSITPTVLSSAKCSADREIVMIGSGQYKCAKDLTDPE